MNNHRRSIQLPDEHLETLREIFGCRYEEDTVNGIRARLDRDYYISNILKVLLPISKSRLRYQELYTKSKIRSEDAFLKYLRWMMRLGLLAKDGHGYGITTKGMLIVQAFSKK